MIIVDTNVLSEEMRSQPEPPVRAWFKRQRILALFTTAICEAEILSGVERLPAGRRKRALAIAARRTMVLFAGRILPFDSAAAPFYAQIWAERRRLGRSSNSSDVMIAAIARLYGMSVATRNTPHFIDIGIDVIDPWQT